MSDLSLVVLARYFLRLGTLGFGGPIALVGYMQRDLTQLRSWFTEEEFRNSVVFSQLAPGPLAAQVAIHLGWMRYRVLGATLVGIAFVLPSFLLVLGFAVIYENHHGLPWLRSAFYGISAAVVAILVRSTIKLTRLTVKSDRLLIAVFALNAIATAITGTERIGLLLLSGMFVVAFRHAARAWHFIFVVVPPFVLSHQPGPSNLELGLFFAQAGSVVFGSGLAIIPFLQSAVSPLGWLTEQQFVDAIAVSLLSPGPVVITVAFMGYLIDGIAGALIAAAGVFLPVYLAVILLAPWFDRWVGAPALQHAIAGLAAAATGSLAGAALIIARRAVPDLPALLIAALSLAASYRFRWLADPVLVLCAAVVGVVLGWTLE
ncbi:MAG: chromate efflux transporter [Longimicrobiales bacterium]